MKHGSTCDEGLSYPHSVSLLPSVKCVKCRKWVIYPCRSSIAKSVVEFEPFLLPTVQQMKPRNIQRNFSTLN